MQKLTLNEIKFKKNCNVCNMEFLPKLNSYGIYCSLSCSSTAYAKISAQKALDRKILAIANYNLNPQKCKLCTANINYEKFKNRNIFCNSSCAATYNNSSQHAKISRKYGPARKIIIKKCAKSITKTKLFCKIDYKLCTKTNEYYINKDSKGRCIRSSPFIKTIKEKYYSDCRFRFNVYHYPEEFDINLLQKNGWYTCPGKKRKNLPLNVNGVSRDHLISISYGFENNISADIIAHPANCKLILQVDNIKKHKKCDITIDELIEKIDLWNKKYNN